MKKSTEIEPADHATGSSVVAIQALRKSETHSRRAADVAWLRMELENDA